MAPQSSNNAFSTLLQLFADAKCIQILCRLATPNQIQSLDWFQGLFAIRHSPRIHWKSFDDDKKSFGSDFWFYAQNEFYQYRRIHDQAGNAMWTRASTFAEQFHTADVRVPFPHWMRGTPATAAGSTDAGYKADQVTPFEGAFTTQFPNKQSFETTTMVTLLRESDRAKEAVAKLAFPTASAKGRFTQYCSTRLFKVELKFPRTTHELVLPSPGSYVRIKRADAETIYNGMVAELDTSLDIVVIGTTKSSLDTGTPGHVLENVQVDIENPTYLIDQQVLAVTDTIHRAAKAQTAPPTTFHLRSLLWGTRLTSKLSRDMELNFLMKGSENAERVQVAIDRMRYDLDPSQRTAFDSAIHDITDGLATIQGPPGTGKSATIARITVSSALLGEKTKFTTPQNSTLDANLEKVVGVADFYGISDLINIVRIRANTV
ncbi:hypothetical protein SLS55_003874 [Diplodia seriata]|uniref:DNA2/NAM7 helicase helicase domain-containing protein n=1 Tax=Diplodia seriata TaxID=420778 RepID=A0ABR3CJ02_9PEZI